MVATTQQAPSSTSVCIRLTESCIYLRKADIDILVERFRLQRNQSRSVSRPPVHREHSSPPTSRQTSFSPSPARGAAAAGRPRDPSRGRTYERPNLDSPRHRSSTLSSSISELSEHSPPPTTLRGLLTLTLSKPTRIKKIGIKFRGLARSDWPEGELFTFK